MQSNLGGGAVYVGCMYIVYLLFMAERGVVLYRLGTRVHNTGHHTNGTGQVCRAGQEGLGRGAGYVPTYLTMDDGMQWMNGWIVRIGGGVRRMEVAD